MKTEEGSSLLEGEQGLSKVPQVATFQQTTSKEPQVKTMVLEAWHKGVNHGPAQKRSSLEQTWDTRTEKSSQSETQKTRGWLEYYHMG